MSTETIAIRKTKPFGATGRRRHADAVAPVLDGDPGRVGGGLFALTGRGHPVRTFLVGVVLSLLVIAGLSIVLGLLVTRVLLQDSGIDSADASVARALAHHRSAGLTEASLIGSIIAGGVVLPILVAVCAVVAAAFRQWRVGLFLVFALAVESGSYRATTLLVHRHRPEVPRLEKLPVNASYPSGHTAAAIAVYCGLALLLTSRIRALVPRLFIWASAMAIPIFVAFARMYRGMHHPLDVAGGVAIGVAALTAMVLVSRATGVAAKERDGR
jgi:membrane-associated phospholipid phosphatase